MTWTFLRIDNWFRSLQLMQLFMVCKKNKGGGGNSLEKSLNQRLGQKRTWVESGVESPVSAHVSSHGYRCNILFRLHKNHFLGIFVGNSLAHLANDRGKFNQRKTPSRSPVVLGGPLVHPLHPLHPHSYHPVPYRHLSSLGVKWWW